MKFIFRIILLVTALIVAISYYAKASPTESHVVCLAKNMFYEARNQGTAGLLSVVSDVLNRVNDSRFPNSICEVIKQGPIRASWKRDGTYYPIKHRCQFSSYCDGKSDNPKEIRLYEKYLSLAEGILNNEIPFLDITDGATFYHADYVTPGWAKTKHRTIEIEDHIFYKWKHK